MMLWRREPVLSEQVQLKTRSYSRTLKVVGSKITMEIKTTLHNQTLRDSTTKELTALVIPDSRVVLVRMPTMQIMDYTLKVTKLRKTVVGLAALIINISRGRTTLTKILAAEHHENEYYSDLVNEMTWLGFIKFMNLL